MKECKKCNQLKSLNNFWKDKYSVDGKWHTCKECARTDKYHERRQKELNGKYQCYGCSKYKDKRYFCKDSSRNNGLNPLCRNCTSKKSRKRNEKDLRKYILARAKYAAKSRGLEFNLTLEDIIIPKVCPLLEIPLEYNSETRNDSSFSLDRIDNSKGYVKGNVWVISAKANTMKSHASFDELITFSSNCLKFFNNDEALVSRV